MTRRRTLCACSCVLGSGSARHGLSPAVCPLPLSLCRRRGRHQLQRHGAAQAWSLRHRDHQGALQALKLKRKRKRVPWHEGRLVAQRTRPSNTSRSCALPHSRLWASLCISPSQLAGVSLPTIYLCMCFPSAVSGFHQGFVTQACSARHCAARVFFPLHPLRTIIVLSEFRPAKTACMLGGRAR